LFEALLRTKLEALTQKAAELEESSPPAEALVSWLREGVEFTHTYRGVVALMASAHANPNSAVYAPCQAVHAAGARLLHRAQAARTARADMDGKGLFALMSALAWASRPTGICATGGPSLSHYHGRNRDKTTWQRKLTMDPKVARVHDWNRDALRALSSWDRPNRRGTAVSLAPVGFATGGRPVHRCRPDDGLNIS
jgi:hypothetical protein